MRVAFRLDTRREVFHGADGSVWVPPIDYTMGAPL